MEMMSCYFAMLWTHAQPNATEINAHNFIARKSYHIFPKHPFSIVASVVEERLTSLSGLERKLLIENTFFFSTSSTSEWERYREKISPLQLAHIKKKSSHHTFYNNFLNNQESHSARELSPCRSGAYTKRNMK